MNSHGAYLLSRRTLQFLAVFDAGSIFGAAERLNISQPALSMSIRQLEEEIGTPLFHRRARGVEPTEAGQALYRYALSIRQSARLAHEEVVMMASATPAKLRLGAGVAWTTTVLPPVLVDLQTRYPGISIDLLTGVGDQLADLFMQGEIDVFVAAGSMPQLEAPDIVREFVGKLPMVAVADPRYPLLKKSAVTPAELGRSDWAGFYEDEGFLHHAQHYMALRGLRPPRITMRTNSVAALTTLVKNSNLVTILTAPHAKSESMSSLRVIPLSEPLWEIPVNIYFRRTGADPGAIRVFRESFKAAFSGLA